MLKPLVVSFALTGLGVSALGADESGPGPATWRWHVTRIMAEQRARAEPLGAANFDQHYQRYSVVGLPEPPPRADAK